MSNVAVGILADHDGLVCTEVLEQGPQRPELRRRAWMSPSDRYRDTQDPVPIDVGHNGIERGRVIYLERNKHGQLWCVGHIDPTVIPATIVRVGGNDVLVTQDLYWSASRWEHPDDGSLVLHSVALTPTPARLSATPVRILEGELDYTGCTSRWSDRLEQHERELLERAASAHVPRRRDHRSPLRIRDTGPPGPGTDDYWPEGDAASWRPRAEQPRGAMRQAGARGKILSVR